MRQQVKGAGGLRSTLMRIPQAFAPIEISGKPGAEMVRLMRCEAQNPFFIPTAVLSAPLKDGHAVPHTRQETKVRSGSSDSLDTSSSTTVESPRQWGQPGAHKETRVVKLRGLPFSAVEEEVQRFVEAQLLANAVNCDGRGWPRVQLLRNRDGRASGFAHVHFAREEDVDRGQRALHLSVFGDRYVEAFIRKSPGTVPPRMHSAAEAGIVVEVAAFLGQRPDGSALLSEIGVALTEDARAALRNCGGLKQVVEASPAFCLSGTRGAEQVRLAPADPGYLVPDGVDAASLLMAASAAVAALWPEASQVTLEPKKVRLRGLPFSATEDDVREFLARNGAAAWVDDPEDSVRVQRRNNGRPTGNALLQFRPETDLKAISAALDGKHMGDRYIEVLPCEDSK
jgi:RNA recognition motif-containing protein